MTSLSNIAYLRDQLTKLISEEVATRASFMITRTEQERPTSNHGEIKYMHVLPKYEGKKLNLDEAIDLLVAGNNTIPLWVSVEQTGKDEFRLEPSARFRKRKVVEQRNATWIASPFARKEEIEQADAHQRGSAAGASVPRR